MKTAQDIRCCYHAGILTRQEAADLIAAKFSWPVADAWRWLER